MVDLAGLSLSVPGEMVDRSLSAFPITKSHPVVDLNKLEAEAKPDEN